MTIELETPNIAIMDLPNPDCKSIPTKRTSNQSILVVDDAADTRMIVSRLLEFDGFECLQAFDGKDVLDLAEVHNPRLIILDLMLPNLNGFQILQRLGYSHLKTKVCVLSAFDRSDYIKTAFEFGALDYLLKPVSPELLAYKVRSILREANGEKLFAINSDLQGLFVGERSSFESRITRISEVGVIVIPKVMPRELSGLFTLRCPILEKICGHSEGIFVRCVADNLALNGTIQFDFVAMSESLIDQVRAVVNNGRFLSGPRACSHFA